VIQSLSRSCKTRTTIKISGNALLFLSGLVILFPSSLGPKFLFPSHRSQMYAIEKLGSINCLMKTTSTKIDFRGFDDKKVDYDEKAFNILAQLINQRSPKASELPLDRIISVCTTRTVFQLPGGGKFADLSPVYIGLLPTKGKEIENIYIAEYPELTTWVSLDHQVSLNLLALSLLTIGFLLQLIDSILEAIGTRRTEAAKDSISAEEEENQASVLSTNSLPPEQLRQDTPLKSGPSESET
jgi:hypothetical protein